MPKSPTYSPLTLAEMRAIVARTLRDTDGAVFGTDALNDFIIEGLAGMSGYRPIEAIESLTYDPVNYGDVQYIEPAVLTYIWQVVATNDNVVTELSSSGVLPYGNPGESALSNGWDFYSGRVWLGRWLVSRLDAWNAQAGVPLTITLYGYRDRLLPDATADANYLDLEDAVDQLCLTRECRALGLQLLNNDRALYQQWLAATNNTDVSPTQLNGMLNGAVSDVERQRKRSAIYRRSPVIGPQYV
jgi:hypothetical protein